MAYYMYLESGAKKKLYPHHWTGLLQIFSIPKHQCQSCCGCGTSEHQNHRHRTTLGISEPRIIRIINQSNN